MLVLAVVALRTGGLGRSIAVVECWITCFGMAVSWMCNVLHTVRSFPVGFATNFVLLVCVGNFHLDAEVFGLAVDLRSTFGLDYWRLALRGAFTAGPRGSGASCRGWRFHTRPPYPQGAPGTSTG